MKMGTKLFNAPYVSCYANDNSAFIPEIWAMEGLAILQENMVVANLVNRDFQPDVANFGDVVNTRRPGTFYISRRDDGSQLDLQDASALNVQVPLNQWFSTSFPIRDGEASKSFKDLVQIYLVPGMQSIARAIDRVVLGQIHKYFGTPDSRVGRLGKLDASNAKDFVLDARETLNKNNAPLDGRRLVVAPGSETAMLKTDIFLKANERGDGGTALENATLGRILGFDTYLAQNVAAAAPGKQDIATGTVDNALGAGGSGSQDVTITGYQVVAGEFAVVDGNDQPTHITAATTGGGNTTAVTLNEANKYATLANAAITVYKKCDVDGAVPAGWAKEVVVDGWTKAPQAGQLIAFGTGVNRHTYTIIESRLLSPGRQGLLLDRPLQAAVADNAAAFPGPVGAFNWAFHRDALALVTRPLALPPSMSGVMSSAQVYNDIGMRVTIQYDIYTTSTIVNCDILAGVAVLDERLCVPLLG
jgi:hypothetical protein